MTDDDDDELLSDEEVEALIAPFRPAHRAGVDRWTPLTLEAHRALNLTRPVTDTFQERPPRSTDVIVVRPAPRIGTDADKLDRARDYKARRRHAARVWRTLGFVPDGSVMRALRRTALAESRRLRVSLR